MSFDWTAYLRLARELARQTTGASGEEARLRSAISRAYYAAFIMARNHRRDKEGHRIPPGGQAHEYVRDQFARSANTSRTIIADTLLRLRRARNRADYDDTVVRLSSVTEKALRDSAHIIAALNQL